MTESWSVAGRDVPFRACAPESGAVAVAEAEAVAEAVAVAVAVAVRAWCLSRMFDCQGRPIL